MSRRALLVFFLAAVAIAAVGARFSRSGPGTELREAVLRKTVTPQEMGSGRLASGLQELELLEPLPYHEGNRYRRNPYQPAAYSTEKRAPEELPSSRIAPREWVARGLRVVSIWLPEGNLEKLMEKPLRRGRDSEQPAYLSLFENDELLWAGGIGLRLHGGRSRIYSPNKSFRAYFRSADYDSPPFERRLLGWQEGPHLLKLVLHNDLRQDAHGTNWHFMNPLAYELAQHTGALVPQTAPALVAVNGQVQGLYFLTEYIDSDYLDSRFEKDDWTIVRTKRDRRGSRFVAGSADLYRRFRAQIEAAAGAEELGRIVDLESLDRWFLSILYCGTTDPFQGSVVRSSQLDSRWWWIHWDMDHSFMQAKETAEKAWEADLFDHVVGRRHHDERNLLLRKLLRDDAYRRHLRHRLRRLLEEELEPSFLDSRYEHYASIARRYGVEDAEFLLELRQFLDHRAAVVARQAEHWLGDVVPPEVLPRSQRQTVP